MQILECQCSEFLIYILTMRLFFFFFLLSSCLVLDCVLTTRWLGMREVECSCSAVAW